MPRRSAFALALALIAGPIVCGAVFFMATRPAQTPGVYVEIADGLYLLPACAAATTSAADVSATAAVAPGEIRAFYLVLPDDGSGTANAEAAKLSLRVVNHAEPQTDYGRAPLATTVRRMNSRVYRVTSDQALRWDSRGPTNALYRRALAHMLGNRATTEVLVEVEVPDPRVRVCRYAMTLGPPPSMPDNDVRWFVPASEKRP